MSFLFGRFCFAGQARLYMAKMTATAWSGQRQERFVGVRHSSGHFGLEREKLTSVSWPERKRK